MNSIVYPAARVILAAALLTTLSSAGRAQQDKVQQELSNPIASLTVVPIQTNYDGMIGPTQGGSRATINVQPVIPFKLSDDISLVVRTIVPIVSQSNVFPGAGSQFGLSDTLQSFFFVPPTTGGFTWGAGPALQYRTGTDPLLTSGKWAAGPTGVALKQTGPWTLGLLTNHIWSYAGDAGRSDVSATYAQPFVAYDFEAGWTATMNTQTTYDWVANQWSVPLLASVSKLVRMGSQPVSVSAGVRYWAASPDSGPHGAGARLSISFVFP